jgi:hypothetical protein
MTEYYYKCLSKRLFQQGGYTLEAVQPEHIEKIRVWRNEQMDILRQQNPISQEDQIQYYKNNIWSELKSDEPKNILLSYKYKGNMIGYGGLVHISWSNRRAEISFICDPKIAAQGKLYRFIFINYLELIRDLSFKALSLNRLFTETFSYRKDQISILEDFGMDIEGVLKSSYKINGKYCDSVIQSTINK